LYVPPEREREPVAVKLTKHNHACVAFEKEGSSLVIDPGSFSQDAAEIIAGAEAILITHEHFDHVHESAVNEALAARPGLKVYAPASLAGMFSAHPDQFIAVSAGDELKVAGFTVTVHGDTHAVIHPDIPVVPNVGYLVDGGVYHPGDAYFVPEVSVSTLLLPTSGPWTKLGETADYVRAVRPDSLVQIHEMILSEIGQNLTAAIIGEKGLTGIPLTMVPVGESFTV
jgi:L-ascorbate metabolism protein UlaG (beta-lactamase superfamily)